MSDKKPRLRISISGGTDGENFAFAAALGHLLTSAGFDVTSNDLERLMQMSDEEADKLEKQEDRCEGLEIVTVSNPPV